MGGGRRRGLGRAIDDRIKCAVERWGRLWVGPEADVGWSPTPSFVQRSCLRLLSTADMSMNDIASSPDRFGYIVYQTITLIERRCLRVDARKLERILKVLRCKMRISEPQFVH